MTDKEIINRLTELAEFCRKCGNLTKENDVLNNALELINRQQAEIERLKNSYKQCAYERDVFLRENPVEMALLIDEQAEKLKTIKTEAIKEFAERLKKSIKKSVDDAWHSDGNGIYDAENVLDDIDNLVKEMVGDDK